MLVLSNHEYYASNATTSRESRHWYGVGVGGRAWVMRLY
jgi:hypothetical protein